MKPTFAKIISMDLIDGEHIKVASDIVLPSEVRAIAPYDNNWMCIFTGKKGIRLINMTCIKSFYTED